MSSALMQVLGHKRQRTPIVSHFIVAVGLLLFSSCGPNSLPRADVEGTVTFQGEPIQRGFILFVPVPGTPGAPVQLNIKDGRYSSKADTIDQRGVVVGENDVQILADKTTGKKVLTPDGTMVEQVVNAIPEKYNEQTELRRTIKPGKNVFDFELE